MKSKFDKVFYDPMNLFNYFAMPGYVKETDFTTGEPIDQLKKNYGSQNYWLRTASHGAIAIFAKLASMISYHDYWEILDKIIEDKIKDSKYEWMYRDKGSIHHTKGYFYNFTGKGRAVQYKQLSKEYTDPIDTFRGDRYLYAKVGIDLLETIYANQLVKLNNYEDDFSYIEEDANNFNVIDAQYLEEFVDNFVNINDDKSEPIEENKTFDKIFNEVNRPLKEYIKRDINWRPTGLLEFELKLEDNNMIGNFFESLISLGFGFTIKPRGDSGYVDVGLHVTYLNEEIENVLKSWLGEDWGEKVKLNGRV